MRSAAAEFAPESAEELQAAVDTFIQDDWDYSIHAWIVQWDVSRVTTMSGMFLEARTFNGDISKWDVSKVNNMDAMFSDAKLFQRDLCGAAWVNSKATKTGMFDGSFGSISGQAECTPEFSPQTKTELKNAVDECKK